MAAPLRGVAEPVRKALILPGAGARGAYQVGVLKALAELLPAHAANPFSVICGTSAGAINAAVLASRTQRFRRAVSDMEQVWANFTASQVFRTDSGAMLKASLHWFATLVTGGLGVPNPRSLLDNSPLRELLASKVRFSRIAQGIDRGYLDALAITTSAYTSSRSVTFFQAGQTAKPWSRVRRVGRPARIDVDHLMASAAVPIIFPPVRLGGEYFGDGSMRHRAPLSPAVHLGADRMLVVSVRDEQPDPEPPEQGDPPFPSLAHLGGYMLDALFLDGLSTDLERLTRVNRILEQAGHRPLSGPLANLRPLHVHVVLPSEDIRSIAARHAHELPRPLRLLLRGLGAMKRDGMQLVSYLLFESGFTRELIDLGYRDAMKDRDRLEAFLLDEPIPALYAPEHLRRDLED
jgi:NTE family protein